MAKDVKIEIVGDASKYKAALADAGSSSDKFATKTKSNGEQMSKFGLGALAVAGAVGVGLFKAGEAASNLGESVNAVQVTFGDAASGILKLGEEAATTVGLSNVAFNGLAVQFSNFAQTVAGKGGDVVGVMKDLTGRAGDFASVMNIEVKDAAVLFQSGLAGETEPLRKYGIDLSAAAVQAYAAAHGIGTLGQQLTESEKVTARYGLLMQSTAKDQGDFANTSGSAANATRIAKAEMENAAASLGQVVAPVIATVATKVASLSSGFVNLNEKSGGLLVTLAALGAGGAGLIGVITSVVGRVQKAREAFEKMGSAGKVLGVAMGVAAIAMVAYSLDASDTARANANLTTSIENLSKVADADLLKTFIGTIVKGMYAEKDLKETTDQLATANLEGALRVQAMINAHIANGTATQNEKDAIGSLTLSIKSASVARLESTAATDAAKVKVDALTASTETAISSTDAVALADKLAAGATDALKAAHEEAKRKVDAFAASLQTEIDKLDALYPKEYDAVKAKYDYRQATEDSMIAVGNLNTVLGDHKSKEEDIKTATDNARDAILGASEKYATMEGAATGSEGAIRRQIQSLKDQEAGLAPGSPLRQFLDQYIADLKAIPSNISTIMDLHISQGQVTTAAGDTIGKRKGAFASGTESAPAGIADVAENGMELVVGRQARNFRGGERVLNNRDTKAALGGRTVYVTNHWHGITDIGQLTAAQSRQLGWELRK